MYARSNLIWVQDTLYKKIVIGYFLEAIDSVTANNEALKAAASAMADAQLNQTSQPLARPRTPRRVPVLNPHLPPPKCAHHGSEKCPQHGSHSAKATIAKSVNGIIYFS